MKNNIKKILSLVACAAISISTLTACSGDGVELLSFIPKTSTEADFNGAEFKIVGYYRAGIAEVAPVSSDNMYTDMLLEHYDMVSEKFNIKIVAEGSESISDDMQLKASTGDKFSDIIDESLGTILNLYNSNLIMEVDNIIDYSELHSGKYGTETQLNGATLKRKTGDVIYGFQAGYWGLPTPKFANAGYFNPDMVARFNLDNPYELIENDKWTWDIFEKMCINCASGGLDPTTEDDDTYGVAEDPQQGYVTKSALASNDVAFISFNEETGRYEYNLSTPEFAETIEWVKSLHDKGGLKIIEGETANSLIGNVVNNFIEGRSFFLAEHTYHGTTDRESLIYKADFEFNWIPFPKGPRAENYVYGASVSGADRYFAFPSVDMDEEMLQVVVPTLFSQFEGLSEYEWRDYFAIDIFFNDESEKWFYHMYDNLTNNHDYIISFFNNESYLSKILSGEKTMTQVLDSYISVGQDEIDDLLNVE